jgi:hypothetical protein
MRFFPLLDFQHMVLALFLGIAALVFVYVAWSGYSEKREKDLEEHDGEVRFSSEKHPMPPLLIFVYAGVVICMITYLILIGIFGGPI